MSVKVNKGAVGIGLMLALLVIEGAATAHWQNVASQQREIIAHRDTNQKDSQNEPAEADGNSSDWSATTWFTGVLAVVGALQVGIIWQQANLTKGQLGAAIISANAATDAADRLKITERAFLFVEIDDIGHEPRGAGNLGIILMITNYGKTPGNVRELKVFFRALDHLPTAADEGLPRSATQTDPRMQRIVAFIGNAKPWRDQFSCDLDDFNAGNVERAKINIKGFFFYVWGSIEYKTVFGDEPYPTTKFKLGLIGLRWVPVGPDEDNEAT